MEEKSYIKEKDTDLAKKSKARDKVKTNDTYSTEQLEGIAEKLDMSRGYTKEDIREKLKTIQDDHGYSRAQMTRVLQKLDQAHQYSILHYATMSNNVPFCQIVMEEYNCSKSVFKVVEVLSKLFINFIH